MVRRARMLAAVAWVLSAQTTAVARPYTVEDLLGTEGFGNVVFDPAGRWLVFERLGPFDRMQRYDMLANSDVLRSQLYRVDLVHPRRAVPLLSGLRPGTVAYAPSPDGKRLAVGHLRGDRWQLGVVTMATGRVRWFDLTPEYTPFYPTLAWVSNEKLVAIATPGQTLPLRLRAPNVLQDRLARRWAATRTGIKASVTAVGSGRFRDATPMSSPNRLMLIDGARGTVSQLASGRFLALLASPGRARFALVERGPAPDLSVDRPVSQVDLPYRQMPAIYDMGRRQLWRPCGDCDMIGLPRWSPDGGGLAFVARRGGEAAAAASIFKLDAAARAMARIALRDIRPVVTEKADGTARPSFAWRGKSLLIYAAQGTAPDGRRDWYALNGERATVLTASLTGTAPDIAVTGRCAAATTNGEGIWCLDGNAPARVFGPDVRLQTDATGHAVAIGWHRAEDRVIFAGEALAGAGLDLPARSRIDAITPSPLRDRIVLSVTARDGAKALVVATRDRGLVVASANRRLHGVDAAVPRKLTYNLPDGRGVTSWLYLPAQHAEGPRIPMVVVPYPERTFGAEPPAHFGPGGALFYTSVQLMTAHGLAVLEPGMPASPDVPSRSAAYADMVGAGVDAAVATGAVDPDRVALWGHSFGGYAVAMIAAQTDRYKAVVASAGVYDLAAIAGEFGPDERLAPEDMLGVGYRFAAMETGQGRLGVPPWRNPGRYTDNSPVYLAGRIRTPMLLIGADRDPAYIQQSEALFSVLARQGKDAELVTYWGEGHVVGSPANVRDLYARVLTWLDRAFAALPPGEGRAVPVAAAAPTSPGPNAP